MLSFHKVPIGSDLTVRLMVKSQSVRKLSKIGRAVSPGCGGGSGGFKDEP